MVNEDEYIKLKVHFLKQNSISPPFKKYTTETFLDADRMVSYNSVTVIYLDITCRGTSPNVSSFPQCTPSQHIISNILLAY